MGEVEASTHDIKLHFARRVTHQARHVLEIWQNMQANHWAADEFLALFEANSLLARYANRFAQHEHAKLADDIGAHLATIDNSHGRPSSAALEGLSHLMQRLAYTSLRHSDQADFNSCFPSRKPLYLALRDRSLAEQLHQQLTFFGLNTHILEDLADFQRAHAQRYPEALLLDIDFAAQGAGLALAKEVQSKRPTPLPIMFFSRYEPSTEQRLCAVRCASQAFFTGHLEASVVMERLSALSNNGQIPPYKVLIIDDSHAQALHTERVLNSAGIITRILNEPMQAMQALAEFKPDLITLDMYMPECNGPELAKLIRQDARYLSMPILYLSGEEDLEKQLDALSEGAEDFLTKPIKPHHLIASVRNHANRARRLHARIVSDSLTGLYNHTHILQLLDDCCLHAHRDGSALSFVMVDIDHFKQVNDRYGHPMGDRVIKSLALFLQQRLRKTDFIGRYGGEEFALIMPNTDAATAAQVINDIRLRFAEIPFVTSEHTLQCSFSSGIAQLEPEQLAVVLAQQADGALYQAKQQGRNRVCCALPATSTVII